MDNDHTHTLMLVDDEPSITRALQRVLRRDGYRILTAAGGPEALQLLETEAASVSLIISDQRMPQMTGAEFLEKAKAQCPDAIRFLLTGYSDLEAVTTAVNRGEIHRYLTKPWDDDDLRVQIRQALAQVALVRENRRLQEVTRRQNRQLYEIGLGLDRRVKEKTRELTESRDRLETLNRALEDSLTGTVRLLSALVDNTCPVMGRILRRTGELARTAAEAFGLPPRQCRDIETAGLLCDIGLLGMPQTLWQKDTARMNRTELDAFSQHPVIASISLEAIEHLVPVGEIVLYHHEHVDGSGFPNGLRGEEIPLGARIVAAASEYGRVIESWPRDPRKISEAASGLFGHAFAGTLTVDEPEAMLREVAGKLLLMRANLWFDMEVVTRLLQIASNGTGHAAVRLIEAEALTSEMTLARDLKLRDGRLLLAKGTGINAKLADAVRRVVASGMMDDRIFVNPPTAVAKEGA